MKKYFVEKPHNWGDPRRMGPRKKGGGYCTEI